MKGYTTRWLQSAVLGATLVLWGASAPSGWTAEQPAQAGTGVAAETAGAETAEPAKDSTKGETAAQAERKTSAEKQGDPSPEIFVPTEEVSEDFAISFPVDI
jgi:hypothetical protein